MIARQGKTRPRRDGEVREPVKLTFERLPVRGHCSFCAHRVDGIAVVLEAAVTSKFFVACFNCIRGMANAALGE